MIRNDLNFVLENWNKDTCDLWEEIKTNDFFWNLMAYRHTLAKAADFATSERDLEIA